MEQKILYFEKPGSQNQSKLIKLARKRASELDIETIVVATTHGGTAQAVKTAGATLLRGGMFKLRTSAESFQGLGREAFTIAKEIKKQIGFMPSEVQYYEKMDVHELLRYSANFYEADCEPRIKELAEMFDLDLDRKIIDLSRGNQKKVSILQSLIHEPGLLILDEPTSGLDPLMQAKFFDLLKEENSKGTTVFFSSHTLSEVQKMCRRVGIIKEGKIIAVEDIETLRKKQLRKIQVEFAHPVESDEIECVGMIESQAERNVLSFMFSGKMNDLLEALAGKDVKDLIIEEPSLEEIFIHYYSEEGHKEKA